MGSNESWKTWEVKEIQVWGMENNGKWETSNVLVCTVAELAGVDKSVGCVLNTNYEYKIISNTAH